MVAVTNFSMGSFCPYRPQIRITVPSHSGLAASWIGFAGPRKLGVFFAAETGFIVARSPDAVLAPDIGFVRVEKIHSAGISDKFFALPPDFAVEVLSPGDSAQTVEVKALKYLDAGTRLVWVVNPRTESVTVYQPGPMTQYLKKTDTITGEDVLPGFSCAVAEFFTF